VSFIFDLVVYNTNLDKIAVVVHFLRTYDDDFRGHQELLLHV
jgi:hypothetical protein